MANSDLIRSWRGAVVGVLLTVGVVGLAAQGQSQVPAQAQSVPVVIGGDWPRVDSRPGGIWLRAALGDARVRVATDGARAVSVERVSGPSVELLEHFFTSIRTWQFAPHSPTSFETVVRVVNWKPEPACYNFDKTTHWSSRLPLEIVAQPASIYSCNWAITSGVQVKVARGRVVCECPGERPIAGAYVELIPEHGDQQVAETVTNRDGWFDLGNVQNDVYRLLIYKPGYHQDHQIIRVAPWAEKAEMKVALGEDPTIRPPPPAATVLPGAIITYPDAARRNNIEGIVRIRMSTEGSVIVLDGPFELREAALSNVRTWRLEAPPSRPFEIQYRYRLETSECGADSRATVMMRPPYEVDISARRYVTCGAP